MRQSTIALTGLVAAGLVLSAPSGATAQPLEKAAIEEFMLTAKVVASERIGKGVTNPWRLTLSDGAYSHDVAFQSVNQKRARQRLGHRTDLVFVDAYRYNIAAYRIAELLGIDHMMPVTVERAWKGKPGAMSWWVDNVMMDERERDELDDGDENKWPDDIQRFYRQRSRMLVFAELVYDTDRNKGNVIYDADWKHWMIDFSRAFRLWHALQAPSTIPQCDWDFLERMRGLTRAELRERTGEYLTAGEMSAVLGRRDKLVPNGGTMTDSPRARSVTAALMLVFGLSGTAFAQTEPCQVYSFEIRTFDVQQGHAS